MLLLKQFSHSLFTRIPPLFIEQQNQQGLSANVQLRPVFSIVCTLTWSLSISNPAARCFPSHLLSRLPVFFFSHLLLTSGPRFDVIAQVLHRLCWIQYSHHRHTTPAKAQTVKTPKDFCNKSESVFGLSAFYHVLMLFPDVLAHCIVLAFKNGHMNRHHHHSRKKFQWNRSEEWLEVAMGRKKDLQWKHQSVYLKNMKLCVFWFSINPTPVIA